MRVSDDLAVAAAIEQYENRGGPPLSRLWGLARHLRTKHVRTDLSDADLFALTLETLSYCTDKFDVTVGPKTGLPRMGTEDRFVRFFGQALAWRLLSYQNQSKRQRGPRRGDCRYRGLRGDEYATARQPRFRTALLEMVNRAIARLDEQERAIVVLRYWQNEGLDAIAKKVGYANRFKARRDLDRAHEKLRGILMAEADDVVVGYEEDLGLLAA